MPRKKKEVIVETPTEVVEAPTPDARPWPICPGSFGLFTKDGEEFVGSVLTYDPLEVISHEIVNGVKTEQPTDIASLDGYDIRMLSSDEIAERFYK